MNRTAVLALFISFQSLADVSGLNTEFVNLVSKSKIGTPSEQSYCYSENGKTKGYQPLRLQRIASVTKLLTSYLASETLNLRRTYTTRFYIGKDSLHIDGSSDPYFEEEKLLVLLKTLNQLGYKTFKKVTFTRDFLFYDTALDTYERITPEKSKTRLALYFSSKNKQFVKSRWQSVRKFAMEEGIKLEETAPSVSAEYVAVSDLNPLINENTLSYVHVSKPLHTLLKTMNVQSKNLVAENVYEAASAVKPFPALMKEKGIASDTYKIYNGSGLPIEYTEERLDNFATCDMVLKVVQLLSGSLKKHGLQLSDVVAVNGGKDLGSFRDRFRPYPETHEAVISKTGTLKHTSTLAGVLLLDHEVPFAILNHTANPSGARRFQDLFVSRMFDHLGTPVPLDYVKISIFPWDGSEFLRPLI